MVMRLLPPALWRKLLAFISCLWLFAAPAAGNAQQHFSSALARATEAACGKQIVLIGEADHGDGATVEFKAALVENLVSKCGFNAVYFEAGTYDFLKIEEMVRTRQSVDEATLASAISALWNQDEEIDPIVRFLLPRVNSGEVRVGGIDDQTGSRGAFYGNDQMPVDLAGVLPEPQRTVCREQMVRRTTYDYSDEHPHDTASNADLDRCLAEVEQRLAPLVRTGDRLATDRLQMAREFRRSIARDFLPTAELITSRDRGMYENLRWLIDHAGPHRKAIVWTANAHAAKSAAIGEEYDKAPNLGALIHDAFGARAFALGISAAGGSHYWSRKEPSRPIAQAAHDSVEVRALDGRGEDAVFLSTAQLRELGVAPGSFDLHQSHSAQWDRIFDAAVILRTERPPVRRQ